MSAPAADDDAREPSPVPRFIAGLPRGFVVDNAAWRALVAAGAKIVAYHPRLDLLTLEIERPEAFVAPEFIDFLEAEGTMGAEDDPSVEGMKG